MRATLLWAMAWFFWAAVAADQQRAASLLSSTPLLFHSTDHNLFVARSAQFSVQIHGAGFALAPASQADTLTVDLVGASPTARLTGEQRHGDAVVNYFRGSDASQWRVGVPVWERVRAANTYPGIDVVYYTSASGQLEFDFVLQPGADHRRIGMRFTAGWLLSIDSDGSLTASHPDWRRLALPKPVIYQPLAGSRQLVDGGYTLTDDNAAGFWLGDYDAELPLVIDPLVYSTYLGGSNIDYSLAIALDSAGSTVVTGYTFSTDFPTTQGPGYARATAIAFVTKFNANNTLVFSTYLGGSSVDVARGVAVDAANNVIVVGDTQSTDFPLLNPVDSVVQVIDAFVTKFDPSGTMLFSTFLGGSSFDSANGVAVDSAGNIAVVGQTSSNDFPLAGTSSTGNQGGIDAFVTKFNAVGGIVLSTQLGGSNQDIANGVAVDSTDSVVVAGYTESPNFKFTPGAFDIYFNGSSDAFLTKYTDVGTFVFSTYIGGSGSDSALAVAVNSDNGIAVTGYTSSLNFPTLPLGSAWQGGDDAFVIRFDRNGALTYSSYLGGAGNDYGRGVATDPFGNVVVTGSSSSQNFPVTPDALFTAFNNGSSDAFVTRLNASNAIVYSTYLGGGGEDVPNGIVADRFGNVVVSGQTTSSNYPTTANAFDSSMNGTRSCFISKLACTDNCSSHGDCTAIGTCICHTGWFGPDCSLPTCFAVNNCSSHGNCTAPDTCTCDAGWDVLADCSVQVTTTTTTPTTTPSTSTTTPTTTTTNARTRTTTRSTAPPPTTTTSTSTSTTTMTTTTNGGNCSIDSDGDGFVDCADACPYDPTLHVASACGCYAAAACNCTSCPPIDFETPTGSGNVTVTVTLPSNSTYAVVTTQGRDVLFQLRLGWGMVREVASDGRVIKAVDPNDQGWRRITTANETYLRVEYDSGTLTRSPWSAERPVRVQLSFELLFVDAGDSDNGTPAGFELKYSVQVDGDWRFEAAANELHVDFAVEAPTASRDSCGVSERWRLVSHTPDAKTYRIFTANRTAATISYLTHCSADSVRRDARISKPKFTTTGWNTTIVFPSFNASLFYDPSFALLLGYGDQLCDPLLSWILPVAFIGAAFVVVVLAWLVVFIPPVSRLVLGERGHQIHEIRKDIKKDFKQETKIFSMSNLPPSAAHSPPPTAEPFVMQVITNEEEI